MKNAILSLTILFSILINGCVQNNGGIGTGPKISPTDVKFFAKQGTMLLLIESEISDEDVKSLQLYLTAAKDLLLVAGEPNFDGARQLAVQMLPEDYVVIGLAVIDIVERHVRASQHTPTENQVKINEIIVAGLDGASEALSER